MLLNAPIVSSLMLVLAGEVAAQGQPVDVFWSDRWNSAYHRFQDLDQNGSYLDAGEVSFAVDPSSWASFPASGFRATEEDGYLVGYWLVEFEDLIARGVDLDGDGTFGAGEISVYRDSGALDGESWPQDLDITDDGAVWWVAGLIIDHPQNGISRLVDLNGDGDAADEGEQMVMVDGTGTPTIEHDGGTAPIVDPWSFRNIAAAGNGVIAFASSDDNQALYRFEDLNGDRDVVDPDESILFLNATGADPALPVNPDFVDGTLPSLLNQAGYYTFLSYIASDIEDGQRVFYLGTSANGASETRYTNVDGVGINFLIFRAVDNNGDRDINDAGEVTVFFDGNQINGDPPLVTLRGLDALDGRVYAAEITPYPILFPGDDGNAWIHRFEDLDGDGDARDTDERQLGLFDLQIHGPGPLFPVHSEYTDLIADPWDFSVAPRNLLATCAGDINDDGVVDFSDMLQVLADWGPCGGACSGDVNDDNIVDLSDLLTVLVSWGPCG